MTWQASRAMLPLVSRVALDIAARNDRLALLKPELEHLDQNRRTLGWPQRQRRYQIEEEIALLDSELRTLNAELEALGLILLDADCGLVGFPTRVNDQSAYFSWMPGESELESWNYAGEFCRRPVPTEWTKAPAPRSRPRRARK